LTLILHKRRVDLNINKSTPKATSCSRRRLLQVGRGGGTGDNLNQLTSDSGLTLTVVENLEPGELLVSSFLGVKSGGNVLVDHLTSVLGGVLHGVATSLRKQVSQRQGDSGKKELRGEHTEISQAWPSAMAQKRLLARAYSRRLARASSSISKAEMLAGK
jgi:hypothetical protein